MNFRETLVNLGWEEEVTIFIICVVVAVIVEVIFVRLYRRLNKKQQDAYKEDGSKDLWY